MTAEDLSEDGGTRQVAGRPHPRLLSQPRAPTNDSTAENGHPNVHFCHLGLNGRDWTSLAERRQVAVGFPAARLCVRFEGLRKP